MDAFDERVLRDDEAADLRRVVGDPLRQAAPLELREEPDSPTSPSRDMEHVHRAVAVTDLDEAVADGRRRGRGRRARRVLERRAARQVRGQRRRCCSGAGVAATA